MVPESLVRHESRWWLYYGAADKVVCLAFGRQTAAKIGDVKWHRWAMIVRDRAELAIETYLCRNQNER